MYHLNPQYLTDSQGKKISVVLSLLEYETILEKLEELEDIRLYDDAIIANEPFVPMEKAFEQIEREREK